MVVNVVFITWRCQGLRTLGTIPVRFLDWGPSWQKKSSLPIGMMQECCLSADKQQQKSPHGKITSIFSAHITIVFRLFGVHKNSRRCITGSHAWGLYGKCTFLNLLGSIPGVCYTFKSKLSIPLHFSYTIVFWNYILKVPYSDFWLK